MIHAPKPDPSAIFRDGSRIDEAIRAAARSAALENKRLGLPLIVWRDGRVVEVPPDRIDAELERAEREAGLR